MNSDLSATLLALERQLMDPAFRRNREQASALLAVEFKEFGSSGKVWSREEILDPRDDGSWSPPTVEEFAVTPIAKDYLLATYKTTRPSTQPGAAAQAALRSSLWIYRDDRWQMLFHQGTKIP